MTGSEPLRKQPKRAVIAAAVAVVLASSAAAQDQTRDNPSPGRTQSRESTQESTRIARGDTAAMQSLEQHLQTKPLRVSKLVGMEVQNRSGDNLGEVEDIVRSVAPGQDLQLLVAVGGGIADGDEKLIALPFDEIQVNSDGDELYTNRTRDQLASAPAVTTDGRTAVPGAQPRAANPPSQGGAGQAARASLGSRRTAALVGADVVGSGGDKVGEIDDIVISTAGADSIRAVLKVGGVAGIGEKHISLPLNQLQIERSGDDSPTARVAMDRESLERMPEFEYDEQTSAL
jgi:sporulation protein YlmC with PRC-barrel domain